MAYSQFPYGFQTSLVLVFPFPSLHFQKKKNHYFKTQSIDSQMNLQLVGFQAKY